MLTHISLTGAVLALLSSNAPFPRSEPGSRGALTRGTWAITNVAVVPMHRDTVLLDATVVVRDGRIAEVGPAGRVRVPRGARRVDGRGRYLIPGLADMHTHLFSDGDYAPDSAGPAELGVMLANGVTVARFMIGTPEHLALRAAIEEGRIPGPQLWVASPQFTGRRDANARTVTTPDEARAAVREVKAGGYDFIKLTLNIPPEVYDAIVDEAGRQGLRVAGHVDARVGVPRALAAGQQIEHLDNFMEQVLADSAPSRQSVSDVGVFRPAFWATLDHVDDAKVERLAGATARAGVAVTPTLTMFKQAFALGVPDSMIRARPDWQMMPEAWRRGYLRARDRFWANPASEARRMRYVAVRDRMVKAIVDSGGTILAGSDSPEWFLIYGWSLHRELESLVSAGLTPFQALAAATVNPAAWLGGSAQWGTIEPGKRADLVLIEGNPLADIRNTARVSGVAMGGRWFERAELDAMIRAGTAAINGAPPADLR